MAILSLVRYKDIYLAIQELNEVKSYSISRLCKLAGIQRSSYYKWLKRTESKNESFNKDLMCLIRNAYEEKDGILGYRQMTVKLNREHRVHINKKRIYRLM